MLFLKETIELLRDSPFKQFVLMELERERIYQSFVQIDELDEISQIWLSFSRFCADSLSDVSMPRSAFFHQVVYDRISFRYQ